MSHTMLRLSRPVHMSGVMFAVYVVRVLIRSPTFLKTLVACIFRALMPGTGMVTSSVHVTHALIPRWVVC